MALLLPQSGLFSLGRQTPPCVYCNGPRRPRSPLTPHARSFALTRPFSRHKFEVLQAITPEESCISCRVAEGYGPDEATATGSGENPDRLVPSPARFAGDMRCGGSVCLIPQNPDEAFFLARRAQRSQPGEEQWPHAFILIIPPLLLLTHE
jgi:hypothetical protein